jgi:hypothetical protein
MRPKVIDVNTFLRNLIDTFPPDETCLLETAPACGELNVMLNAGIAEALGHFIQCSSSASARARTVAIRTSFLPMVDAQSIDPEAGCVLLSIHVDIDHGDLDLRAVSGMVKQSSGSIRILHDRPDGIWVNIYLPRHRPSYRIDGQPRGRHDAREKTAFMR